MRIEEKRREIDEIDAGVLDLLNRRAAVAREISTLKMSAGLPIVDEGREDEVLRRLASANPGLIDDVAVARIWRAILEESRRMQAKVRAESVTNGVGK